MTVVKTTEITITRQPMFAGTVTRTWNVDVAGRPYGQIWTFVGKLEVHKFHAKTLKGDYAAFDTYAAAETFMRGTI